MQRWRDEPATLCLMLRALWMDMDRGGFSPTLARQVLHFNGKLFKGHAADDYVLPLTRAHIDGLLDAAGSNWREVEPAIFGTLLERALDPDERHALGAGFAADLIRRGLSLDAARAAILDKLAEVRRSIGAPSRFAVTRPMPIPSVIDDPSALSSPVV